MSKEENINEVERAAKTVQITGRVSQAVKDEFDQLRESGGYETFSLFMEALLERYNNPLKINKEYVAEIERLKAEVKRLENDKDEAVNQLSIGDSQMSQLRDSYEEIKQAYNAKCAELESVKSKMEEYRGLEHKMDGHILVPVDELDMRCLQYLADRENKSRKREDITPAVFFMYAVREMLIKGNKFAIDSVPDSVIAKFKAEIANGK